MNTIEGIQIDCRVINRSTVNFLQHLYFSFTLLLLPAPPFCSHLLRSAVMPASEVINDFVFVSLSWVCVGESLCTLQMFRVKARLSHTQKNYGRVKCEFVVAMIKGRLRGTIYHTTPKSQRAVCTCQIRTECVQKLT